MSERVAVIYPVAGGTQFGTVDRADLAKMPRGTRVLSKEEEAAQAVDELERRDLRYGLATLCVGGGMGIATIVIIALTAAIGCVTLAAVVLAQLVEMPGFCRTGTPQQLLGVLLRQGGIVKQLQGRGHGSSKANTLPGRGGYQAPAVRDSVDK